MSLMSWMAIDRAFSIDAAVSVSPSRTAAAECTASRATVAASALVDAICCKDPVSWWKAFASRSIIGCDLRHRAGRIGDVDGKIAEAGADQRNGAGQLPGILRLSDGWLRIDRHDFGCRLLVVLP